MRRCILRLRYVHRDKQTPNKIWFFYNIYDKICFILILDQIENWESKLAASINLWRYSWNNRGANEPSFLSMYAFFFLLSGLSLCFLFTEQSFITLKSFNTAGETICRKGLHWRKQYLMKIPHSYIKLVLKAIETVTIVCKSYWYVGNISIPNQNFKPK